MKINKIAGTTLKALVLSVFAVSAQANLITNGGFETSGGKGQLGFNTTANGWTTNGYNFLFASGTADTTGASGEFGNLQLWGPGNGSFNGLPASSPAGGNFIAADGDPGFSGAISQTITGLTVGEIYTLSFWWAGAQQFGFTGTTTEQWQVSLGGQTKSTSVVNNSNQGFTGWQQVSFDYTASSASELLSFLAVGTPSGVPPFVLLDGVSLTAKNSVPEPETLALVGLGLLGILAARRQRKNSNG